MRKDRGGNFPVVEVKRALPGIGRNGSVSQELREAQARWDEIFRTKKKRRDGDEGERD